MTHRIQTCVSSAGSETLGSNGWLPLVPMWLVFGNLPHPEAPENHQYPIRHHVLVVLTGEV